MKNQPRPSQTLRTVLFLFLLSMIAPMAQAATKTWDGGGAPDGNWSNGLNWDNDTAPVAGDLLIFSGTANINTTNDFSAGIVFQNITFAADADVFTLNGNAITLTNGSTETTAGDTAGGFAFGGSISNMSPNIETLALPITFSAGNHNIVTASGAGEMDFTGVISRNTGAGLTFTKSGGNINFSTSAAVPMVNGVIKNGIIGNDWAVLDGGSSGNVVAASYTSVASGAIPSSAGTNYKLTGGGAYTAANGTLENSLLGELGVAQSLTIAAAGTNKLSSGAGIFVNQNSAATLTLANSGILTVNGGGELVLLSKPQIRSGALTVSVPIANDGANPVTVIVRGQTTWNTASKTFSGGLFIYQNGRVNINNAIQAGSGPITVYPGGTFLCANANNVTVANDFYIAGVGCDELGGNEFMGAIRLNSAGSGNSTITGKINLMADARIGGNPANNSTYTLSGQITGNGQLELVTGSTYTGAGSVSNLTILNNSGAANNFTGGLKLTAVLNRPVGVRLGQNEQVPDGTGFGDLIINGQSDRVTFDLNGKTETINGLVSSGFETNNVITNSAATSGTLQVGNNNATSTFSGVFTNNVNLVKIGSGTLTLTGTNYHNGNTTVSAGTLALSGNGSIGSSPRIVVAGGATFDVSGLASAFNLGASQTLSNNTSTAVLNVGSNGANTGSGTVSLTYASGTPSFIVTNGTLTLSSSSIVRLNNTGSALAVGNYKIVSKATSGNTGAVAGTAPSSVTVTGGGIAGGTTASLQITSGELYLVIATIPTPRVTGISVSGVTLTLTATNGALGGQYYLLSTTNLALPFSQWITNMTGNFDGSGQLNLSTNVVNPSVPQTYYLLKQ